MKIGTAIKLCWYNMGYKKAIEDYRLALQERYESNKEMAKKVAKGNRDLIVAISNLDLEEIDNIAQEVLKEKEQK